MKKIIDYTIVTACNSAAIVDAVCEHIEDGWEPFGGICLTYERNIHRELGPEGENLPNDFQHYAQAFVKREMFQGSSMLSGPAKFYNEDKDDG